MSVALDNLLRHPGIWRAGAEPAPGQRCVPSGWPELDAVLPGGGWPLGALTEVLVEAQGVGELGLLLPALGRLADQGLWLAWVAPPMVPYAPALHAHGCKLSRFLVVEPHDDAHALWAAEQLLRARSTGAVLLWTRGADSRRLRRLQLAAESADTLAVLFRPAAAASAHSPAALRLEVSSAGADPGKPRIRVVKCRGRLPSRHVQAG